MTSNVDFQVFDADNHYYEALDAFTRYTDPGMAKRTMPVGEIDVRQRPHVVGTVTRFIPTPPIALPHPDQTG